MAAKEVCYYADFNVCTNRYAKFCNDACVGKEGCSRFMTESDYFTASMNGTLNEGPTEEEKRAEQERIRKVLTPGKSKKQMKREAKLEAEKNRISETGGFSLGDDPVFKNLFKK